MDSGANTQTSTIGGQTDLADADVFGGGFRPLSIDSADMFDGVKLPFSEALGPLQFETLDSQRAECPKGSPTDVIAKFILPTTDQKVAA